MNVEQMEQRFQELKEQREAEEIDDEQFMAEVEKLQFQDRQGQLWRIGASTGRWYCYEEEGRWVQGKPPHKRRRLSKAIAAVLFLVVVVLIVLSITDILPGRRLISWLGTPAAVVLGTETATLPPTATPTQMPTDTPCPPTPFPPVPTDVSSPTPATATLTPALTSEPPTPEPPTPTPELPTSTPEPPTPEPLTPTSELPTLTPEPPTPEPPIPTPEPPTSTPEPSTPEPPPVTGKIAFPVFDPERGTYDIFIANAADGTDRQKIKEEASQPCLSPDGTQIAYRSWRSDKRGLFMADISGNDLWTITTSCEASRPSVSMKGIVYHRRQAPDSAAYIYLPRGGGDPEVIRYGDQLQPLSGESPAWMPGERLVYKSCAGGNCGLYLTDGVHDGTGSTRITKEISDTNPEASPDGKKIVFMSQRDLNWEIYVMVDLDLYTVERLTENAANDGLPIWSPDGQTIAFVSDRDNGEWAVWAMDSDGSSQRPLFSLGGSLDGHVRGVPQRSGWVEERLSWSP